MNSEEIKEQSHEASAKIFAVCAFVLAAYLVMAFVQQVMA